MRSRRVLFSTAFAVVLAGASVVPPVEAGKAADVRTQAFELINQGVTAYKNGDYDVAVAKLEQATSMALNNFRAHYYLGLALIGDRRYSDAIPILDIALELDPNHLQSLVALGDANLKLGDMQEAEAAYFRALKIRPEYSGALDGLARVYESRADNPKAIEYFRRAIDSNRGFAPAYTHLGDLYLRSNQFEEAVDLLEEAVSVRPDFADGLNRLSLAYGRLGLINEAIATIQKAIQLEPNNAAHPATFGELALEQGSLSVAEDAFNTALRLDAGQPLALRGLAEVARRRGDYDTALKFVDTALADARIDAMESARLESYRSTVVEEKDQFEHLEAVLSSGEASSDDYAAMARILAHRGMWEDASQLQQQVDPSLEQRETLAYMLFRANRFREAHELYQGLAAETGSAVAALNDGVTLAMLGADGEAVEMYRKALEIQPDDRTATLFLANALLRLGDQDAAVEAYKTYLRDAGRGERAERVRRILEQIAPGSLPPQPSPTATPPASEMPADGSKDDAS